MVKQGGQSWRTQQSGSTGIQGSHSCKVCRRRYKQEWTLKNHEKACEIYNK